MCTALHINNITLILQLKGVDNAKKEIIELIDALKSVIEKTIIIPHRLHKYIIGRNGVKIKMLYTLFPKTKVILLSYNFNFKSMYHYLTICLNINYSLNSFIEVY